MKWYECESTLDYCKFTRIVESDNRPSKKDQNKSYDYFRTEKQVRDFVHGFYHAD